MMKAIRERYTGEQNWSDHIRLLSTYGTLGLMVVNFVLFGLVHGIMEPRRRKLHLEKIHEMVEAKEINVPAPVVHVETQADMELKDKMNKIIEMLETIQQQTKKEERKSTFVLPSIVRRVQVKPEKRQDAYFTAAGALLGGIAACMVV